MTTIHPKDMTALAQQAAGLTDGNAYLLFFSQEDGWIAIVSSQPGLSGIGLTPEAALQELGIAIALATYDDLTPPFTYPECPLCREPIRPRVDSPERRDSRCLQAGTICGCSESDKPPFCLRQEQTVFVRVPASLQNTPLGRAEAVRRISRAWQQAYPSWRFVDERQHGPYRWWLFEGVVG